ncbi:MAG TPA: hypothetical protein PKL02_00830 [Rectinema sp.]|nr:hypothetical protein [Rectinema sp.]HPD69116.1 hypothetical protein [Rectinema sp.]
MILQYIVVLFLILFLIMETSDAIIPVVIFCVSLCLVCSSASENTALG